MRSIVFMGQPLFIEESYEILIILWHSLLNAWRNRNSLGKISRKGLCFDFIYIYKSIAPILVLLNFDELFD